MAWNMQLQVIACAAFRVLVGETVIQNSVGGPLGRGPSRRLQQSPFGRDLGRRVDEDTESLLQNAAASLIRRVQGELGMLMGDAAFNFLGIQEWVFFELLLDDLRAAGPTHASTSVLEAANALKAALLDVLHFWLVTSLTDGPDSQHQDQVEGHLQLYVPRERRLVSYAAAYATLLVDQKVVTATFWTGVARLAYFPTVISTSDPKLVLVNTTAARLQEAWSSALADDSLLSINGARLPEATRHRLLGNVHFKRVLLNLDVFWDELGYKLRTHARRYSDPNLAPQVAGAVWELQMSSHLLVALDEREYSFLPLWAGGNDDGSGGVFQADIPDSEMGPVAPGPSFHTGHSQTGESVASADWGLSKLRLASLMSGTNPTNVVETGDSTDSSATGFTPAGSSAAPSTVGDLHLGGMALDDGGALLAASRESRVAALLTEYTRQQAQVRASLQETTATSPLAGRFPNKRPSENRGPGDEDTVMTRDEGHEVHQTSGTSPSAHSPVDEPTNSEGAGSAGGPLLTEDDLLDWSSSGSSTPVPSELGDFDNVLPPYDTA